jgi:hypothetical protein
MSAAKAWQQNFAEDEFDLKNEERGEKNQRLQQIKSHFPLRAKGQC